MTTARTARAAALAMVALAGSAAADTTARFRCADTVVAATFRSADGGLGDVALVVDGAGTRLELPQVMSADGGRYAKGDVEFWVTGQTARFTEAGVVTNCEALS